MTEKQLAKYAMYNDSEIDWLGGIPKHWNLRRLKDIKSTNANAFADGPFGSNLKTEHFIDDGDVYVVDSGFITSGKFEKHREFKTISFEHFLTVRRSECYYQDIIIAKIGANFGMSGILPKLEKRSLVSGNTLKLSVNHNMVNLNFIHYQLLNLKTNGIFDVLVKGTAQPALSLGLLSSLPFTIPPVKEQQAIADYLDSKTKQIDDKINLLEQKAEKYSELKQSLINETVTRGLDKSAPMKDSGVAWIGQIPSHWEVKRVKDLFVQSKNKVGAKSHLFKVLSLTQNGVLERDIENGKGKFPATFDGYQIITSDSILLCLFDMDVTPRIVGYVDQIGLATSAYTNIIGNKEVFAKYFYYYFLNQDRNKSLLANGKGLRSTITFDNFALLKLPFPSFTEQKAIAEYLDNKTMHIEKIIETINLEIETLKELRKTLINDVVTGKIKVSTVHE